MDTVFVFGLRGALAALFAIATRYKLRHFAEHRGHVAGYLGAFGIARRGAVTAAFAASGLLTAYALAVALLIALSGLVAYLAATQLIENHGAGAWLRAR